MPRAAASRHDETAARLLDSAAAIIDSARGEDTDDQQDEWTAAFPELLQRVGFRLRPGWTPERLTLAIQVMLDGYLVRSRVEPERLAHGWAEASLFADLVVTFSCGALDVDRSGLAPGAWPDAQA